MIARLFVTLATGLLAVGCGAPSSPPAAPTNVPVGRASGGTAAGAPAGTGRHGASAALLQRWTLESPRIAIYADLEGMLGTKTVGGMTSILVALAGDSLTAPQRTCLDGFVAGAKELALGVDDGGLLALARFDPAAVKPLGRCLEAFGEPRPITVEGASEAWDVGGKDGIVALAPNGVVLSGTKRHVERSLAGRVPAQSSLAQLSLDTGEYAAWAVDVPDEKISARGRLLVTDERFRLGALVDLPSEELAKRVESQATRESLLAGTRRMALPPENAPLLAQFVDAFHVERDGKRLALSFELRGAPAQQAKELGQAGALGIRAVRKYISSVKQAEARNTLGHLAKLVVMAWELEDGTPLAKKRLVSYPAVPKRVPKGHKEPTSAEDWKAWAPLGFSMELPIYYQYEIKAAKDGESAEILARGDLDGNGRTSQFKLIVKVRRSDNTLSVSPAIAETDPDE